MGSSMHGLDPKRLRMWIIVGAVAAVLLLLTGSFFSAPASAPAAPPAASGATSGQGSGGPQSSMLQYEQQLADSVQVALAGIQGAGTVHVTLALHGGPSYLYAFNQTSRVSRSSGTGQASTTDTTTQNQLATAGASQSPVLTQELSPKVTGALIVASGASDPTVRQELMQAAQALLGLPAYEIQVLPGGGGY